MLPLMFDHHKQPSAQNWSRTLEDLYVFSICQSILIQTETDIVLNNSLHQLVRAPHDAGLFGTIFLFHEWQNSMGKYLSETSCVKEHKLLMLIDTNYLSMKSACLMDTKEYLISSSNSLHFLKIEECSTIKQNFTSFTKPT